MRHRRNRKQTVDVPYTSALIFSSPMSYTDQAAMSETLLEIAELPELAQAA